MKKRKYNVEIQLEADGSVGECSYTCPRGKFLCHHMVAALLAAHKNISKTDILCSWKAPATEDPAHSSIKEIYPPCKFRATTEPVDENVKQFFLNKLEGMNRFCGFYMLLKPEPCPPETPGKKIQDFLAKGIPKNELLSHLTITREEIREVATATIGQRDNSLWNEICFGRITASNFGIVLSSIRRIRYTKSLYLTLLGKYNLEGVKSVQWGLNHEVAAIDLLEQTFALKVEKTGIWLHDSGVLGASPDGLVGDDALVKVKCPFRHKDSSLEEMIEDSNYCLERDGTLKVSYPYYDQVQGQLHVLQHKLCYFVTYTLKALHVIPIRKEESWESNINLLLNFYKKLYLENLYE